MAKAKLRRIGVLSVAKFQGVLMAFLGLIVGVFFAIFGSIIGAPEGSLALFARMGFFQ